MLPTNENLRNVESQIEKITFETGEKLGAIASTLTNTTTDYKHTAEKYVEENPIKSLAIVVGAGIILGAIFTFISRKRD